MSAELQSATAWDGLWETHLANYAAGVPRTALFLLHQFPGLKSAVELGAGSARDSAYLASQGVKATATDFSSYAMETARSSYPDNGCTFEVADAFNMPYPDKSFELVFHNGLIVLFDDDQIRAMLREHLRLASGHLVILAHNADNARMKARFAARKATDKIFDIRFFTRQQIAKLVMDCGVPQNRISFRKFGGPADIALRVNALRPAVPALYRLQPWSSVERIACVVSA